MNDLSNFLCDVKLDHNTQEQLLETAFNKEIDYMVNIIIEGDLEDDMIFTENPLQHYKNDDHIKHIIKLVTTNNYGFNLINRELMKKGHMITNDITNSINKILEMYINHLKFHLS